MAESGFLYSTGWGRQIGSQWTVSLWVLTTAVSQSTLKFPIRTAVKEQCLMHPVVMPTSFIRTTCLLYKGLDVRRRNYSPQASIPFCPEAWVVVHWFLNQNKSSPALWKRKCFKQRTNVFCPPRPFSCLYLPTCLLTLICPRNGSSTFWSQQTEAAKGKKGEDVHNQRPNIDMCGYSHRQLVVEDGHTSPNPSHLHRSGAVKISKAMSVKALWGTVSKLSTFMLLYE